MISQNIVLRASLLSFVVFSVIAYAGKAPQIPTTLNANDTNDTNSTHIVSPAPPGEEHTVIDLGNPDEHNCVDIVHFHSYPDYTLKITFKKHTKSGSSYYITQYSNWTKEYNATEEYQSYHMHGTSYDNGTVTGIVDQDMTTIDHYTLNTLNIMPIREITHVDVNPGKGTFTAFDGSITPINPSYSLTRYMPFKLFPTKLCAGAALTTDFIVESNGHGTKQRFREEVLEIGVMKHVPAGTFKTVHMRHDSFSPVSLKGEMWFDLKTGIMVYSEDDNQITELTSMGHK